MQMVPQHHCLGLVAPNWLAMLTAACLFGLVAGCGNDLPKTIPVVGKLTYNGQQMPGPGFITFTPIEVAEGSIRRPGRALFDESGVFEATSWNPGDGLAPGRYLLRIDCWQVEPTMQSPSGKSHIPERYNSLDKGGITVDVSPESRSIDMGIINIESP